MAAARPSSGDVPGRPISNQHETRPGDREGAVAELLQEIELGLAEGCAIVPTSDQVLVGSLFPAEKMMVAAARTSEQTTTLTALFEVTGRAQSAHVRADADKLARALVAMGTTDSFLLAWLHSHPGRGAQATVPSSIDRKQQEAWLQDYSPDLLGLILVEDGFVRIWGEAVEEHRVEIMVQGAGIIATEEPYVYRITG